MKTILLIEDNADIRENMAEILEMSNYKVITASDGKEGVSAAIEHIPDVIVCDIMMPVLDGYGVIHMLQKNDKTNNIPFIFLTAKAERTEIRKGMELGADDYITKPFSGTELLNAIESRLKKAEISAKKLPEGISGLDTLITTVSGEEMLNKLKEDRTVNVYKKKQLIYSEGNHVHRLYYIQTGKVKVYKTNEDGKELIIDLHSEGDFFGFKSLLQDKTYTESAEAIEDCEISVIPKEEFEQLVNGNKEILKKFVQLLAKDVSDKENQLLNLAYNSLRKKVADALVILYNKYHKETNGSFRIDMSRENLANIAGTAKESLIRTLSDFKDEKLIDIQQGEIVIIDIKKLNSLLN